MNRQLLSSEDLVSRLESLLGDERQTLVQFLGFLALVDERMIPLELGYSSTWSFLTKRLNLSESHARRRITAARLLARFPMIAEYLLSGRLNLTTLCELRDLLDGDTVDEILEQASGLSEAAVRALAYARRSAKEAPLLPVATGVAAAPAATPVATPSPTEPTAPPAPPEPASDPRPPELHRFQLVVTREFLDDLEAVKALLSHKTRGDTAAAVHEALRITRAAVQKKKLGCGRPGRPPKAESRNVPSAVKVPVWERDAGRCTFVSDDGRVCGSTFQLQFHHLEPFARGGPTTVENLTLRCSLHNALDADRDYGKDHIERQRTESDVHSALVNLGFKKDEARKAVTHAREKVQAKASVHELLRAALHLLTIRRGAATP